MLKVKGFNVKIVNTEPKKKREEKITCTRVKLRERTYVRVVINCYKNVEEFHAYTL